MFVTTKVNFGETFYFLSITCSSGRKSTYEQIQNQKDSHNIYNYAIAVPVHHNAT